LLRQELRIVSDPVRVLRDLWLLDFEAVAVQRTRLLFEKAARDAPDDDRVWLGLANLDRRAGQLDDAEARLRKCLVARPDAPAGPRGRARVAPGAPRGGRGGRGPPSPGPPPRLPVQQGRGARAASLARPPIRRSRRRASRTRSPRRARPGRPRRARAPRRAR